MIYDKIKIYVTARVGGILSKDAESFEFFKKDRLAVNKNALLTALILNYSQEFNDKQESLYKKIKSSLTEHTFLDEKTVSSLCYDVAEKVNREFCQDELEKFDCLVSLKPTKDSQSLIDYTEEYRLNGSSLSEYYRNMFSHYANLSQDKREQIIFKPVYETITKAIKDGKKIFITTRNGEDEKLELSPYSFARSKEEMHNYLLASIDGRCKTFRLSRITSAVILRDNATFSDEEKAVFKKMQEYGPQFTYSPHEDVIVVRLTPTGIRKFQKIYVHRPIPKKVEGNFYHFDCSEIQVIQYFQRFGADAFIVSPFRVRNAVFNFHRQAVKAYKEFSNDKI